MSENPSAVYSCPSCGALSQVDASADDGVVCTACGHQFKKPVQVAPRNVAPRGLGARKFVQRDVVLRRRHEERGRTVLPPERPGAPDVITAAVAEPEAAADGSSDDWDDQVVSDDGHKRVVRRRKKRRKTVSTRPVVLGAIWIVVVVAVLIGLSWNAKRRIGQDVPTVTADQAARQAERAKMQAYIDTHFLACRRVLNEFWQAPTMEEQALLVYQGQDQRVIPLMDRFFLQHGSPKPTGSVNVLDRNLIMADEFRAIETRWEDESGSPFEVVFVQDDEGKWQIDWEAYVRYCSTRWDVFLSGTAGEDGDFRLLMREVDVISTDENIGVKFYPAGYQNKDRRKGESDTVLVPIKSPLGRKVRAVLDGLGRPVRPGEAMAWTKDPTGMARVRVLLQWRPGTDGEDKVLYLKDLLAGSWLAEEFAPPVLPESADEAAAGGDPGGAE